MTPDELRALRDAATPGPWRARVDQIMALGPPDDDEAGAYIFGSLALYDATGQGERDARLIALAPTLATLVADMAEQMEAFERILTRSRQPVAEIDERMRNLVAPMLERLSELGP